MRYAGFWIRLLADILDSTLLTIVSWVLEYALLGVAYFGLSFWRSKQGIPAQSFDESFNDFWMQVVNVGIYFCISFPYYVWGHFRWGTTLGKKPFGIQVVQAATFSPITLSQSIGRFFAYGPSYLLFICGFFMAAFHPEKRALHELLSGTVSIRRERKLPDAV